MKHSIAHLSPEPNNCPLHSSHVSLGCHQQSCDIPVSANHHPEPPKISEDSIGFRFYKGERVLTCWNIHIGNSLSDKEILEYACEEVDSGDAWNYFHVYCREKGRAEGNSYMYISTPFEWSRIITYSTNLSYQFSTKASFSSVLQTQ